MDAFCTIDILGGRLPIVAAAIHDGHAMRPALKALSALRDDERLREEDPFTGYWTEIAEKRILVHHSRFEVDINRPPDKAVYRVPEDAWGLSLWKDALPCDEFETSLERHRAFYARLYQDLSTLLQHYERLVVFDLHSYNHKREGRDGPEADPALNPEVNVGTGSMLRGYWAPIVDAFLHDLQAYDFQGRRLDVRENIKFKGGYFPQWIHEYFPGAICCLAIEWKKFFMDEWSGEGRQDQIAEIRKALDSTIPGVLAALGRLGPL